MSFHFNLYRPCSNCPFRTDIPSGWLGKKRARDIAKTTVDGDQTFSCHKTTNHDENGEFLGNTGESHCAGALIMIKKLGKSNSLIQIAERFKMYDPSKLDMSAPVFDTVEQFIEHHKY